MPISSPWFPYRFHDNTFSWGQMLLNQFEQEQKHIAVTVQNFQSPCYWRFKPGFPENTDCCIPSLCCIILGRDAPFWFILIHLGMPLHHASVMWELICSDFRSWHTYAKWSLARRREGLLIWKFWIWNRMVINFLILDRIRVFWLVLQMCRSSVSGPRYVEAPQCSSSRTVVMGHVQHWNQCKH